MSAPLANAERRQGGRLASLKQSLRGGVQSVAGPLVRGLARLGVRADHLTVAGFALSVFAGLAFFEGGFRFAALLVALAGLCDILDGALARERAEVSRFGAFMDSTLDRLGEAALLGGIVGYYLVRMFDLVLDPSQTLTEIQHGQEPNTYVVIALTGIAAMTGSFLVSYTRARAEGLGLECKVGWFERPERLGVLILAGAFGVGPAMPGALLLLALMSFATAFQRVAHVWKITRDR